MHHAEIAIEEGVYEIRADLKSPKNGSDSGVILAHGSIVNRKSLSRTEYCLAEYLCRELKAYVLTPDWLGETKIHSESEKMCFEDSMNVMGISIDYLSDILGVEKIVGLGHSMGSYLLANVVGDNDRVVALSTYGGPIVFNGMGNFLKYAQRMPRVDLLKGLMLSVDDLSWIFDVETREYFYNIMLKRNEYGSVHYNLEYEVGYFLNSMDLFTSYLSQLRDWSRPVLISFGDKDTTVRVSRSRFKDGKRMGNVEFRVIEGGCHITPCREEPVEISKLRPIRDFLEHNLTSPDDDIMYREYLDVQNPNLVPGE